MACIDSQQQSKTRVKTEFVKVGQQVVHLELHTLETDSQICDSSQFWPSSSDVKEILRLLQTVLEERLLRSSNRWRCHDTAHKPVATKPCVISGEKVRIAYSFKNRSVHQKCLLPERGGQYSGFSIFREKVVIYACPLHPRRKEQTSSSACKESLPLSSSYFSRQTKPETGVSKGPQAALRNIIKKSGPKLSKIKPLKDINKKKMAPSASEKKSWQEIKTQCNQHSPSCPISGTDSILAGCHKGEKKSEEEICQGNTKPKIQESIAAGVKAGTTDSSERQPDFSEICEGVNIDDFTLPKINESLSGEALNSRDDSMKKRSALEIKQLMKQCPEDVSEQAVAATTEARCGKDLPGHKAKKWNFKLSGKHKKKPMDLNNISSYSPSSVCRSDYITNSIKEKKTMGLTRQTIVNISENEPNDLKLKGVAPKFQLNQADQNNSVEEEWGTDLADQDFYHIDLMPQSPFTEDQPQKGIMKEQELNQSCDNSESLPTLGLKTAPVEVVQYSRLPDDPCVTLGTRTLPTDEVLPTLLEPTSTSEIMEKEPTGNRKSQTTPNRTRRKKEDNSRRHANQLRKNQAAKRLQLLDDSEDETRQENTEDDDNFINKYPLRSMLQWKKIVKDAPRLSTDLPSASFVSATRCRQDSETEMAILQQGVAASQHVRQDDAPKGCTAGLSPAEFGIGQIQCNRKAKSSVATTINDCKIKPLSCSGTSIKRTAPEATTVEPFVKRQRRQGIWKRLMNLYNPDFDQEPSSESRSLEEDQQVAVSQSYKSASHETIQPQKGLTRKKKQSLLQKQCDAKKKECPVKSFWPREEEKQKVNAFSLMIPPKPSKKTTGIGSQLIDVGHPRNPGVMGGGLEDEVKCVSDVGGLTEAQLAFVVTRMEPYLRDIFTGKSLSKRHQDYKGGGKACSDLRFQIPMKCFEDDQRDIIMDLLLAMFCRKHNRYLDYVMKVMLPECLVKIYMDVHSVDHESAEAALCPPPPVISMPSRSPKLPNSAANVGQGQE